jgi:hypothetical protein
MSYHARIKAAPSCGPLEGTHPRRALLRDGPKARDGLREILHRRFTTHQKHILADVTTWEQEALKVLP